jgi:bacterioferritin-associated ferredoxin
MIVCICHHVTDRDIARYAAEGASCLDDLRRATALGSSCGKCNDCADMLLQQARQDHARPDSQPTASALLGAATAGPSALPGLMGP